MGTFIKLLFFILFIFYSTHTLADPPNAPRLFIFHINGINVLPEAALRNQLLLKNTVNNQSNLITWGVLYNATHGLLASDLWDVFRQKRQEGQGLSIDDYVAVYMRTHNLNYPINSPAYIQLKDQIKNNYTRDPSLTGRNFENIVADFHARVPAQSSNILDLLNNYRNTRNARVLLIPHSQGNLYANQLWDYLVNFDQLSRNYIAIFGIANPADKINGTVTPAGDDHRKYVTADNDFVINSLRIFSFLPISNSPMPGNIHLRTCNDHTICHDLIDAYLADSTSKITIARQINLFISALSY